MRWAIPVASVLALLAGPAAFALEATQFRQLVVLNDTHVGELLVEEAGWLGDERGLVLGGWEDWPTKAALLVVPAEGQALKLAPAAATHFALSPSRQEIAYWAVTGGTWCQLAIVALADGRPRYVGEPRRVSPPMNLAWPTEHTICALLQEKDKCTAVSINAATGALKPLVEIQGGQWLRMRKWPGWDPIAVWAGQGKKAFRLSPLGRSDEISADFDYDRGQVSSTLYSYFDENGALFLGGLKDRGPVKVADDAGAACWAPDGSMLLYAKRRELWSVWPATLEQRQVLGSALDNAGLEAAAPNGMSWSGDGGALAYWRPSGSSGQVRRAQLGLEEIVIRVKFDKGVKADMDQPLWIAKKLNFDKQGRITEPVWSTVKAKFAVRKVLPGPEETIIEAVNVGAQAGALTQVAGRSSPEAGAVPGVTPLQFSLKPLPELIAWLQGTHASGQPVGVEVRRVPLGAAR